MNFFAYGSRITLSDEWHTHGKDKDIVCKGVLLPLHTGLSFQGGYDRNEVRLFLSSVKSAIHSCLLGLRAVCQWPAYNLLWLLLFEVVSFESGSGSKLKRRGKPQVCRFWSMFPFTSVTHVDTGCLSHSHV